MTKADLEKKVEQTKELRKNLTTDAAELEQNLMKFNETLDPLVDPDTKKPLCWIIRPTQSQWEEMMPSELLEYRNTPDDIPPEILKKYQDQQFEMMAKLIKKPEHDSAWWKAHANLVFQELFQLHLRGVMEDLGLTAENF